MLLIYAAIFTVPLVQIDEVGSAKISKLIFESRFLVNGTPETFLGKRPSSKDASNSQRLELRDRYTFHLASFTLFVVSTSLSSKNQCFYT